MDSLKELALVLYKTLPKDLVRYILSKYYSSLCCYKIAWDTTVKHDIRIHNNNIFSRKKLVVNFKIENSVSFKKINITMTVHSGLGQIPTRAQFRDETIPNNIELSKYSNMLGYRCCGISITDSNGNLFSEQETDTKLYIRFLNIKKDNWINLAMVNMLLEHILTYI